MKRLLLVDDERALAAALAERLAAEGYATESAYDGIQGAQALKAGRFDLAVLDVMLPGRNGFELLKRYRQDGGAAPVLMLTAKASAADTVSGLRLGADDYLAKPFDMDVLVARIEALLRRSADAAEGAGPAGPVDLDAPDFGFGPFKLVHQRAELLKDGAPVALSYREFTLLAYLVKRRGELVANDTLLDELWGYDADVGPRTVYTHIAWLRQKLRTKDRLDGYIRTVRNIGYMFCD
jgi:DNA-binding response OmpR family regulator